MFDAASSDLARPAPPPVHDGPDMRGFVRRHLSPFVLLAVVIAQLMLLSLQITRNHHVRLIRYWTVQAFDPLERSVGGMMNVTSTAYITYRHLWHAEQENRELQLQLVAAQVEIQRLGQEAGEAEHLRNLLGFRNQLGYQTVAAEVIASSPGENSSAIFIDKGSDSGLTNDLAVIVPEGVVGKIVATFPHSAQVLLITDPSSGVGVSLAQSRVQGILKGGSNSSCDLHYVMNEEAVNRGEQVVTSGLDQVYPKGLPVGTVIKVGDGNIYKTIAVKPAVDLNRLEMVLVVIKPPAAIQQAMNGAK